MNRPFSDSNVSFIVDASFAEAALVLADFLKEIWRRACRFLLVWRRKFPTLGRVPSPFG